MSARFRPVRPCHVLLWVTLASALPAASGLSAQQKGWDAEGEVGASLFFGTSSQTTLDTRLAASRADSAYEVSSQVTFGYGEAAGTNGARVVAKRAWGLHGSLDWRPYSRWSPFVSGDGESSFQRRIAFRYNVGAGAKYTFVRSDRKKVDLSAALLAEQSFLAEGAPPEATGDGTLLARWSVRFRARRKLSARGVTLSTEDYYRPAVGNRSDYVLDGIGSVGFALTRIVTLQLSLHDIYDSRAVSRGADTDNEGQLLLSILVSQ